MIPRRSTGYRPRVLRHPLAVLAAGAIVFGATLATAPAPHAPDQETDVFNVFPAALFGMLCYPALFLVTRARTDYGSTWRRAFSVALAGAGWNAALLLVTVPIGLFSGFCLMFAMQSLLAPLSGVLPLAACHAAVMAMAEEASFAGQAPPRLVAWSAWTVMPAMAVVFVVSMFCTAWPPPLLAGAAVLAVLPHLALMPVPTSAPAVATSGGQAALTSSGGPRAP